MKKILPLLFTCAFFGIGHAQQPSMDFETWNPPPFGFPNPQGWTSANIFGSAINDTVCHKATSPDVHSGNFSMKLETIKLGFNLGASAGVPDTVCFALTGNIVSSPSLSIKPGFPFTGRPSSLQYYYKYSPSGNDSATAGMFLTKWMGSYRDTVAKGKAVMGAISGFTLDSVPLSYNPVYATSGNPDTAIIYFASSNIRSIAVLTGGVLSIQYNSTKIGSKLWVDDLMLTPVGIKENGLNELTNIFPVPATETLNLTFKNNKWRKIIISNPCGNEVENTETENNDLIINTSKYPSGVYYLTVQQKSGENFTKKFVVSH